MSEFERIAAAYRRGAEWQWQNAVKGTLGVAPGLKKAAYDYADKTLPPVDHVAGGRWRVFEAATERGWWGIELEEAGNDDDPILYPVKIGRNRLDALVAAHNDAIASDGAEACAGEHQEVLDAIQSHNSGEEE